MSALMRPYKRFPAYKDSTVEWLEKVPASWTLQRLRYVHTNPSKSEVRGKDPAVH